MAENGFKRKLTAILSADVEGYSRLMDDNEEATVRTLTTYRNAISDLVQQYRGRVVDSPGDNLLAEFTSVVDAVNCTVEIQRELAERNAELPHNRKMEFRIGVNLGDVIEEEGQIYGDGVNIAARVESLAEAGGICISGRVYDQVANKLGLEYENLGEHEVKNISTPIRVYKVFTKSEVDIPDLGIEIEVPDKSSIAVLPFVNMSGDPSQEYFSDGLTEQIINGLCKISNLLVLARNSTFAYKGKSVKVQQIGKDLGVRYVLEGSVQRAGDRVRITAQLIDTTTGYHLWSDNYDREITDIFALQDEITLKLMETINIKLTHGEQARLWAGATTNIQAYDKFMRGAECLDRFNEKDNAQARIFYEEAINLDNNFALAYAMLGFTHLIDIIYGWSKSPLQSFEQAEKSVRKALDLNDSLDVAHGLLGMIYVFMRQYKEAIKEGERAVALNPNGADAHAMFAMILIFSGEVDEAVILINRALRLNPIPPPSYYMILGSAYRVSGQHEKAIEMCKRAIHDNPDYLTPYFILAACYSALNRSKEAHESVNEILRIDPHFSLEQYAKTLPFKEEDLKILIDALRDAGLK